MFVSSSDILLSYSVSVDTSDGICKAGAVSSASSIPDNGGEGDGDDDSLDISSDVDDVKVEGCDGDVDGSGVDVGSGVDDGGDGSGVDGDGGGGGDGDDGEVGDEGMDVEGDPENQLGVTEYLTACHNDLPVSSLRFGSVMTW